MFLLTLVCYAASAPVSSESENHVSPRQEKQIPIFNSFPAARSGSPQLQHSFSPTVNGALLNARTKPASEASIFLEKDGVFFSHSDIDTPEELTEQVLRSTQTSFGAPSTKFSSVPGFSQNLPTFYSSPAQANPISSFDNQFVGSFPSVQPFTFSQPAFSSGYQQPFGFPQPAFVSAPQQFGPTQQDFVLAQAPFRSAQTFYPFDTRAFI